MAEGPAAEAHGSRGAGIKRQEGAFAISHSPFAIRHSQFPIRPLLVIVGPTAVGKTALSLHLAQSFDGEVVSADSRLFYRGMDVGTAKPTPEERASVPHHLIDVAAPDQTVGLAEFQEQAYAAIDDVHARGRLPLLVGGTGQYVRAVLQGWRIPRVPPDPELRAKLETQAEHEGAAQLHARLAELDPDAAARIDSRNVRRVIRALEVCLITGRPISQQQRKQPPPYRMLQIGLTMERSLDNLYRRIPSEDLDLTITAMNVQREVGGNLAEILDTISYTIRERVRIKGEIRVLTSQVVYSSRFLSSMPFLIAIALWFMNRPYMMMFFQPESRMIGIPVLIFGGFMILGGYLVMNKISDIEV